jgi:hypothetical protein
LAMVNCLKGPKCASIGFAHEYPHMSLRERFVIL